MSQRDDTKAADLFFDSLDFSPKSGSLSALGDVAEAFSRLPYENVSKVLKTADGQTPDDWRRYALEVIEDHLQYGFGGTCYSLTDFLRKVVATLGFASQPLLADMPTGVDRHCALLVNQGGENYLVDPGYLICKPVTLPETQTTIDTPRGKLLLVRNKQNGSYILNSVESDGSLKLRYVLKADPVAEPVFVDRWNKSFYWPQMDQIIITQYTKQGQIYLHNSHLRLMDGEKVEKKNVRQTLETEVSKQFGISEKKIIEVRSLINSRRQKKKI